MDLTHTHQTREGMRLRENQDRTGHWNRWGPYLSERAWGTVREDYSAFGTAWDYFPHDHARSRAYRWNEDGLAGICDRHQHICFAIALWNGRDPILKERLFGLTNSEGNHGEDVKEYYFYLDNTPTHSYMKYLYKYPQAVFPYANLVQENRRRTRTQPEYELLDTGVFAENRYFDVFVEYAKGSPEDILIAITVVNRGPEPAYLELLPTIWFRNTWSWDSTQPKPSLRQGDQQRWEVCCRTPRSLLWSALSLLSAPGTAAVHGERHQFSTAVRCPQRHALCQGRLPRAAGARPPGGGEPCPAGHQGGGALCLAY